LNFGQSTRCPSFDQASARRRLQIGQKLTRGLGAGGNPAIGQKAAEESRDEIATTLENADLFYHRWYGRWHWYRCRTVVEVAKEMGALTVGVITRPFNFEGRRHQPGGSGKAE